MKNFTIVFLVFVANWANAQDSLSVNIGADFQSRYILNGIDVGGNSPALQPIAEASLGRFTLGAWGSFSLNNVNANEFDIYLKYTYQNLFSVVLMDLFFPNERIASNKYFNYNADDSTYHNLNLAVDFLGIKSIPIGIHADTYIYSFLDKDGKGNNRFSTYLEVNYKFRYKSVTLKPFIGITPSEGFWGNGFGVVNTGILFQKEIPISATFNLPVSTKIIFNPQRENVFFVVGISF